MGLKTRKILGIEITTSPKKEILEEIQKYLKSDNRQQTTDNRKIIKPLIIYTPNPEIINYAEKDDKFRQIVNTAQINLPDGQGLVWAVKKLHGLQIDRVAGADLMKDLVNLAFRESLTVGLIGGRGGVAVDVRECLLQSFPRLKIEVFEAPEIEFQNSEFRIQNFKKGSDKNTSGVAVLSLSKGMTPPMVKESEDRYFNSLAVEISKKKIDILFVALGFPKQEFFIEKIRRTICGKDTSEAPPAAGRGVRQARSAPHDSSEVKGLVKPLVLMTVGGSFDYISGRVPRASGWIRDRGFEWLYRLVRQPWRIARQLKGAEFFWKVLTIR